MGRLGDLFHGRWLRHTIIGVGLAAIGLATFWGTHIYGKDLYKKAFVHEYRAAVRSAGRRGTTSSEFNAALKRQEMIGMFLVTTGGGLGLLSFGPLCERLGRRATFLLFHIGGAGSAFRSWAFQGFG